MGGTRGSGGTTGGGGTGAGAGPVMMSSAPASPPAAGGTGSFSTEQTEEIFRESSRIYWTTNPSYLPGSGNGDVAAGTQSWANATASRAVEMINNAGAQANNRVPRNSTPVVMAGPRSNGRTVHFAALRLPEGAKVTSFQSTVKFLKDSGWKARTVGEGNSKVIIVSGRWTSSQNDGSN